MNKALMEFIARWLRHASQAAVVWFVTLICLEHLLSGFVTPFINFANTGLGVLILCAFTIALQ